MDNGVALRITTYQVNAGQMWLGNTHLEAVRGWNYRVSEDHTLSELVCWGDDHEGRG